MTRAAQYRRKLDVIMSALGKLPPSPGTDITKLSTLEREGVLHVVQVSVDAALDLVAMLVKDAGEVPEDAYHNLEKLGVRGILPVGLVDRLRQLNGLRNAIVHKYNSFEEARVFSSLDEISETLLAFATIVGEKR